MLYVRLDKGYRAAFEYPGLDEVVEQLGLQHVDKP